VAGRASIVGAAETSVGKVRDHNEDSHFIDVDRGIFAVCDGMGGHAAGEVASALAVRVIRDEWGQAATQQVADVWLEQGTPDARKALIQRVQAGVIAAHEAIVAEAQSDKTKTGMGTTLVGALVVGGDIVFAQCGDSRAYLVRDGIAMQLTEDHTLLQRLLAAGVDVDTSNEGARFKSMLTNALGIGHECKAAVFVVPLADGDRFLLCSDGITEYCQEAEIGEVLTTQPSPARAAQRLVEMALQRGGGDNATALVVKVVEAGETARPSELLHRENKAVNACPLWAKVSPQGRLRALRIALPRDYNQGDKIPAHTLGDRVAWILVDGEVEQDGMLRGPGSLLYPEALLADRPLPDKDGLCIAQSEVRGLALRSDDFREVCEDDAELGEVLLESLAAEIARRSTAFRGRAIEREIEVDERGSTDPGVSARAPTELPAQRRSAIETGETLPPPESRRLTEIESAPTLPPHKRPDPAVLPKLPRAATPPPVARTPTPPTGRPVTKRPANDQDEVARGPTKPKITIPRAETKERPSADRIPSDANPRLHPRGSTPPGDRLIVPKDQRDAAEAQLDRALADLTIDRSGLPDDGDRPPPPRARTPSRPQLDEPEIVVEGGDATTPMLTRPAEQSDPEISIERLVEIEVEEPMNEGELDGHPPTAIPVVARDESSSPEIVVINPGRPITANDTPLVAGTIDPSKPATTKRAKRQTDAPD